MLSSGRGTTAEIPVHNDDTANKQNTVVSISCIAVQTEGKSRCKLLQNCSKEHKHVSKETINLDPAQVPRPNKIWRSRSNRRFIFDWAETLIVAPSGNRAKVLRFPLCPNEFDPNQNSLL